MTDGVRVDPVTFEVIRHRMWAINDDQATMAARLSGSPVVYDAYDFNAALMTADGRGLYSGVYIIHHASTIDDFVRKLLDSWPREDIQDGDMFFTNDPWWGALHANDGILAAPIFWQGEIVAWSGIVMHDNDVGGPVPGSFVVGAEDRFGEAPLLPPVRMIRGFELVAEIERLYLRNHRTPELNALNLRARLAALKTTRARLHDLIERYGVGTVLACQDQLIDYVEGVVRRRLREIPDGTWRDRVYHDHDGNQDATYLLCCELRKQGDRLIVDMTGTSGQAPGAINCARPALEGAVLGVFLTLLCHDLPWAVAAGRRIIDVVAEPGTINNAASPAGVSMASIMATLSTQDVVANVFGQMLMASEELRDEAQAAWSPGINCPVYAGVDRVGESFVTILMDCSGGGGGARSFADGVDSGGILHSMSSAIPNVETTESRTGLLELYRTERQDSCGHGRWRGGVGIEFAVAPHRTRGPVTAVTLASGVRQPEGHGLAGGTPPAAKYNVVVRGTGLADRLAGSQVPVSLDDLQGSATDVQPAKARTELAEGDVMVSLVTGGGGYGDPVTREPTRVAADVAAGLISPAVARDVYGVVIARDGSAAPDETDAERAAIRDRRRRPSGGPPPDDAEGMVGGAVGDAVEWVTTAGGAELVRCRVCHHALGAVGEPLTAACATRTLPLTWSSPLNQHADGEGFRYREFSCPGCGVAVDFQVERPTDPQLPGARLTPRVHR